MLGEKRGDRLYCKRILQ